MLDKMSPRQRVRGAIGVLGLSSDEVNVLNSLVDQTLGNPLVGAMTGIDARTVEEVAEVLAAKMDTDTLISGSSFFRQKLCDAKFRKMIAGGTIRVLRQLPPEQQSHAEAMFTKLAKMDFPEFQREFDNIEHFVSEGILVLLSQEPDDLETLDGDVCVCPKCAYVIPL